MVRSVSACIGVMHAHNQRWAHTQDILEVHSTLFSFICDNFVLRRTEYIIYDTYIRKPNEVVVNAFDVVEFPHHACVCGVRCL